MKVGHRLDQEFCLVESQMVIFNFEEAGDWNRACCHSNTKMCTIWYILEGATSLLSFNTIASILAEIFLILCHTTVLAQPMMSSVTKFLIVNFKKIYMLFAGRSVRMVRNWDLGLENADLPAGK